MNGGEIMEHTFYRSDFEDDPDGKTYFDYLLESAGVEQLQDMDRIDQIEISFTVENLYDDAGNNITEEISKSLT